MKLETSQIKYMAILGVMVSVAIFAALFIFVFPGSVVIPQTISLGPVTLRLYGIILAIAVLSAFIMARLRAEAFGVSASDVENIALGLVVGGFLGARVYHVISDFELYRNNLLGVFAIWNGGLSIFGTIAGGFIGIMVVRYFANIRQPILRLLDWLVPSIALGQAIGRFGNLVNYEAYGIPTNLPWKMFVPPQFRIPPLELSQFFHPLFLYESIGSLLLMAVLLYLTNALKVRKILGIGFIFGLWLAVYGALRFVTELLRTDHHLLFGVRFNLIAAALMVIIGVACMVRARTKSAVQINEPLPDLINYE